MLSLANSARPVPPMSLPGLPEKPFYTCQELADWLSISHEKARVMFRQEPGVVLIPGTGGRRSRNYNTIRIPREVAERVYRRMRVL